MLFKWIILFGALASALGASVDNKQQDRVFASSVLGVSLYGPRRDHGGGGGNKAATVTVTETVCEDSTDTSDTTPTDSTDTTDSADLDSQEHCLKLFNDVRKSQNLPLFESATQSQITCADQAAVYDAQHGYHASFYQGMCSPRSQCECMKNVGLGIEGSVPGDPLQNCVAAYVAEYQYGLYPQENLGHWKIITDPQYKKIACGTDHNGFYTHNFYS